MDLYDVIFFSAIIGLSIYGSYPIVLKKNLRETLSKALTSVAVGIMIFLLADVFSDASQLLYNGSLYGYGSSPIPDAIFSTSLITGFFLLYLVENRSKSDLTKHKLSFLIALGIGFQNLTEGLVFGSLAVDIGLAGIALVVLVGFIIQNVTEGFPIGSPFIGNIEGKGFFVLAMFMVGGIPTILGGAIGFYYNSKTFDLIFDGLAIGAIFYIIFPMLKGLLTNMTFGSKRVIYAGLFIGFMLGFLVNLI